MVSASLNSAINPLKRNPMTASGRIPLAFLLAGLAAGIVLAVGVIASDLDADRLERVRFFASAFLATVSGPAIALLGIVAAAVLAAALRIRNVLYYVMAGAAIGLASSYSVDLSEALENTTDIVPIGNPLTLAATAGLVGGLVYWAILGRLTAGRPN
jgi:hypothetical protein